MTIEAIGAISALSPVLAGQLQGAAPVTSNAAGTDFAAMLDSQVSRVNSDVAKAEGALQQLASGQPVELHDVMISLEKARISVQTLIQIRNRVLEVYQDLSRMQV